jgi:hypothetical protein
VISYSCLFVSFVIFVVPAGVPRLLTTNNTNGTNEEGRAGADGDFLIRAYSFHS